MSGNCQKAIADYTKLIEIEPNNKNHYSERAECYKLLNNIKEAGTDLKKVQEIELIESNRKQPQDKPLNNSEDNFGFFVYFAEANPYLNPSHPDYRKAIDNLNKSIEIYPDYYQAYINRGESYNSLGNYQKAIENFNQAINLRPNATAAYQGRGEAYKALKNNAQAIANFSKIIELSPYSFSAFNAYLSRGTFYFTTIKDYPKALADFNAIIDSKILHDCILVPPNVRNDLYIMFTSSVYGNRGRIYTKLNQYEAAIKDYGKSMEFSSSWFDSFKNEPELVNNILADFEKPIAMNPNNVEAYYYRAIIYIQTGNKQKALEDLQKTAQLFQEKGNTEEYKRVMEVLQQLKN